jgi:cellobiose transport system permease protein
VTVGRTGETRRRERAIGAPGWFTYLVLAAATLLSIFPFYWMFVVASNDVSAINAVPPAIIPGPNFVARVQDLLSRFDFTRPFLNSLIVATSVGVLVAFLCSLAGFAFAKLHFKGRDVLFVVVVGTMMIPTQLSIVPMFLIARELGWVNSLLALIVPFATSAFGVFWMRQYAAGAVDDELLQAARVDGATTFQTFRKIVFPLMRPGAAVLGLFAFMESWNDFFWPGIILTTPASYTVQVALRQVQTRSYAIDQGLALTGSLVATAPLLLLFVLLGRQIVSGIMEGALKG